MRKTTRNHRWMGGGLSSGPITDGITPQKSRVRTNPNYIPNATDPERAKAYLDINGNATDSFGNASFIKNRGLFDSNPISNDKPISYQGMRQLKKGGSISEKGMSKGKSDGGDISSNARFPPVFSSMHPPYGLHRTLGQQAMAPGLYKKGGGVSEKQIACGKPAGVRKGASPAKSLSKGYADDKRSGNLAKSIGMGKPTGQRLGVSTKRVRFAEGGHASDESQERFKKAKQRNDILGSPHYAEGGKVHQGMKALYHALHSHFENEPQMKKLGATKASVDEGEPHRYAQGGHLFMKKAQNPSTKGALHKSLHVPMGKKIPMDKIEKAEHSRSPLLRKRANLAETYKKYRPQ